MTSVGAIIFLISPGKNVASAELFQSIENGRYGVASVQALPDHPCYGGDQHGLYESDKTKRTGREIRCFYS